MKRTILLCGCYFAFMFQSAFAYEREISDVARQISADFRRKNSGLDFRATLAIARFKAESDRLENKGTSALICDAFQKEFLRSMYFEIVERDNLEKLTAEIELKQKGLTQGSQNEDMLKSAEYLLVGELLEDGQNLTVSARLLQASSGAIVSAARVQISLGETEKAADDYRYNAFQSQYGISLSIDGSFPVPSGEVINSAGFASAMIAYRVARPLRVGLGISYLSWNEYMREQIAFGNSKSYRNYSLNGIGPRLLVDLLAAIHPRWNLGIRADAVFMGGMRLEQDIAGMPVWEINSAGAITSANRRVLVTGFSNEGMIIFKPALLVEFLISKRLSIQFSGGYMFSTVFKPYVFETAGFRQWSENADVNGTFAQYQNYNFARRPNGDPVALQMGFVFFELGLSLHF